MEKQDVKTESDIVLDDETRSFYETNAYMLRNVLHFICTLWGLDYSRINRIVLTPYHTGWIVIYLMLDADEYDSHARLFTEEARQMMAQFLNLEFWVSYDARCLAMRHTNYPIGRQTSS